MRGLKGTFRAAQGEHNGQGKRMVMRGDSKGALCGARLRFVPQSDFASKDWASKWRDRNRRCLAFCRSISEAQPGPPERSH